MRVCLPIATDAAPAPHEFSIADDSAMPPTEPTSSIPILVPRWLKIQPDRAAMAEADVISGFYSGVPFEVGRKKHDEYLARRAERRLQRD